MGGRGRGVESQGTDPQIPRIHHERMLHMLADAHKLAQHDGGLFRAALKE
jgi:hypothetical protein